MHIIDSHTHIFPEKIASAAVAATGKFYNDSKMHHNGTAEDLIDAGKRAGIDRFVVFSTATAPHQVVSINNFIHRECEEHPEFIGLGTMHRDFGNFEEEIDRIYALGIRGIKIHPDIQRFDIDDEKMLPLYAIMEERRMFLISHMGDYRYDFSHPRRLARLAVMFPKMRFIGAHFGGWMQWKEACQYLDLPNVYFDTSSTFGFGGLEPAREAFRKFDNTHIFFASDYPMWDPSDELKWLMMLGLDDNTLENVLSKNFENFYSFYQN